MLKNTAFLSRSKRWNGLPTIRPGVFTEVRKYCPKLYTTLDIKQVRLSERPESEYLKEMAGHISHVHVSDVTKSGKTCLPGKGAYDFESLIKRLADTGFGGALIIEAYKNDYDKIEEMKTSAEYLQEILYKFNLNK